jgi:hypothetical protein
VDSLGVSDHTAYDFQVMNHSLLTWSVKRRVMKRSRGNRTMEDQTS